MPQEMQASRLSFAALLLAVLMLIPVLPGPTLAQRDGKRTFELRPPGYVPKPDEYCVTQTIYKCYCRIDRGEAMGANSCGSCSQTGSTQETRCVTNFDQAAEIERRTNQISHAWERHSAEFIEKAEIRGIMGLMFIADGIRMDHDDFVFLSDGRGIAYAKRYPDGSTIIVVDNFDAENGGTIFWNKDYERRWKQFRNSEKD